MLDQLVLATQLALENVDTNEMKSVLNKAYARNISYQADQANSMIKQESANALVSKED